MLDPTDLKSGAASPMQSDDVSALCKFLDRLRGHSALTNDEQQAILNLPNRVTILEGRVDVSMPGDRVQHVILVGDGLLCRFDHLTIGGRQITALHVPGDMCDLHSVVFPQSSWGIATLQESTIMRIPHHNLRDLTSRHFGIAVALWRDAAIDASVLAKRAALVGGPSARVRVAHLICEMTVRLSSRMTGERNGNIVRLTQPQFGDALGLTGVHVNRVLRAFRNEGLVATSKKHVQVLNRDKLVGAAAFDPAYLYNHVGQPA